MEQIQELLFAHGGVLSGSFVRDVIIRGEEFDPSRGDVDVLLFFSSALDFLKDLYQAFPEAQVSYLSSSEEDRVLHCTVQVEQITLDVFAGSDEEHTYLCSPDVDVNCLCYDGEGFFLWYPILEKYGVWSMDEHNIIERALKKQAVLLVQEWEEGEEQGIMLTRKEKLLSKGWTLI